jgi:hypothetical protein
MIAQLLIPAICARSGWSKFNALTALIALDARSPPLRGQASRA